MSRKQYLISLEKSRSVVALVAGVLVFAGTLLCVFWAIDLYNAEMLQYFTLLSNLLSATGAAFMIPYAVEGIRKKRFTLPRWVVLFQFSGAVCVSITMVSALALILPIQGPEHAFSDYNFILHVLTPLATVVLFQCVESGVSLTKREMLLALIPYWLYMLVYLVMVVLLRRWKDIYSTTVYLPFWVSALIMLVLGLAVAAVLRLIQNRRARQTRARITRLWDAGLDSVELKIEAFGLGRYMGQHCENELAVPLDIFTDMSERSGVPMEELIRAFVRGAADSIAERKVNA